MSTATARIDAGFDVEAFVERPLVAHVAAAGPSVRAVWFQWEEAAFSWLACGWARVPSMVRADSRVALFVDTCELATGEVLQLSAECTTCAR